MDCLKRLFRRRVPVWFRVTWLWRFPKNETHHSAAYRTPRETWPLLVGSRAEGYAAYLERSDDLGRTWYRVNDDGTKEGA